MDRLDRENLTWVVALIVGCVLLAVTLSTCDPSRPTEFSESL